VECAAPACIVTGKHDGSPPTTLGRLCTITALLFHQFWRFPDFWRFREGEGLQHFWEFLKNLGLAGGLGLIGLAPRTLPVGEAVQHLHACTRAFGSQPACPVTLKP
jgi:putative oxidoreductase